MVPCNSEEMDVKGAVLGEVVNGDVEVVGVCVDLGCVGQLRVGRKVTLWTKETAWVKPRRATAAQLVDSGAPGLESDMAGPGLRRTRDH